MLKAERGQAMVESAIVLPMYVFLLLGIIQIGMIHQARLMTKFAAYKAVRAGALHNANVKAMRDTALWTLLPMVSESASGAERIYPVETPARYATKWARIGVAQFGYMVPGMRYVDVAICGPTRDKLTWKTREIDFDDPQVASGPVGGAPSWKKGQRTKLRIQVTFNYRMAIPFANRVFFYMAMGKELSDSLYLTNPNAISRAQLATRRGKHLYQFGAYEVLSAAGIYVWPIRASYSMRMQSNLYKTNLPETDEDDRNGDCAARWL